MCCMQPDLQLVAQAAAEPLVPVALVSSQTEVAVCRLDIVAETSQHVQQSHAVSSAGKGDEVKRAVCQQMVLGDVFRYFLNHGAGEDIGLSDGVIPRREQVL